MIKDLYKDEIRDGFLVTVDRKKCWQVELDLLSEIERVCEKYGLRYWADGGTLIGAARHKGFIPWDDDIDLMMFRPDYEKLKAIADKEFNAPYFLLNNKSFGNGIAIISQLKNSNTSAITDIALQFNQGIFLDIFPFDDLPDGSERSQYIYDIKMGMMSAVMNPSGVLEHINKGVEFKPSNSFMKKLISYPADIRFEEYELLCSNHFGESDNVGYPFIKCMGIKNPIKRAWYDETIYLDFEDFKMPVPYKYNEVLTAEFGNWHEFVRADSIHESKYFTTDIPYMSLIEELNK